MFCNNLNQASQGVMHVPLKVRQVVVRSTLADIFILGVMYLVLGLPSVYIK